MRISKFVLGPVLALSLAGLGAASCAAQAQSGGGTPSSARSVDVHVRGGEFLPATVTAHAGERLRLVFTRESGPSCVTAVRFPSLGIEKELPENQAVPVEITAPASGTIAFTCPMQHAQGQVTVQ